MRKPDPLMSDPDKRSWMHPAEDMARLVAWVKRLQAARKKKPR